MTHSVVLIAPESTLDIAARKMQELDIGVLPVSEKKHLVGMLTDRDITVRSVGVGHHPHQQKVRDAMTPEAIFCFDDQDVPDATQLMKQKQVRRLLVLNRDKQLVGIVSLGDVATAAGDLQLAGAALRAGSEPPAYVRELSWSETPGCSADQRFSPQGTSLSPIWIFMLELLSSSLTRWLRKAALSCVVSAASSSQGSCDYQLELESEVRSCSAFISFSTTAQTPAHRKTSPIAETPLTRC